MSQYNQTSVGVSSQPRFIQATNVNVPLTQTVPTQVYQRPLPVQSVIQTAQNVDINRTPAVISQSSIPTPYNYNQAVQGVQSFAINQPRPVPLEISNTSKILENIQGVHVVENKGDYVTTSYPSRIPDLGNVSKVAESEVRNVAALTSNQNNGLKASDTIDWEDYTNKNDTSKGLSSFGKAVPQSFDVGITKKIEP